MSLSCIFFFFFYKFVLNILACEISPRFLLILFFCIWYPGYQGSNGLEEESITGYNIGKDKSNAQYFFYNSFLFEGDQGEEHLLRHPGLLHRPRLRPPGNRFINNTQGQVKRKVAAFTPNFSSWCPPICLNFWQYWISLQNHCIVYIF